MNKKALIITISVLFLVLGFTGIIMAWGGIYTPADGGYVENKCGNSWSGCGPHCYVSGGHAYCIAPSGGRVDRHICDGHTRRGSDDNPDNPPECVDGEPGHYYNPADSAQTLGIISGGQCKTEQLDVYSCMSKYDCLVDFIVWYGPCGPATTTTSTTTSSTTSSTTSTTTTTIPAYGNLKIFKFYDVDGNGIWNSGEDPLPGFEFWVTGPISRVVYTDSNGYVILNNIPLGTYQITEVLPSGWINTVPITQYAYVTSPSLVEVRFGNNQLPTPTTIPPHDCTLNVYVKDQNYNQLDANIYVDDSFRDYDDFTTLQVHPGSHIVEASRSGYDSDSYSFNCYSGETITVNLRLTKISEETDIRLGDLEVDPSSVCHDEDELIELSVPVTLVSGEDNSRITAKFYVEDDHGHFDFIDDVSYVLDVGERRDFTVYYNYRDGDLDVGSHDVKVVVDNGEQEVEYGTLRIKDCEEECKCPTCCPTCGCRSRGFIDVGYISISPEFPRIGDIVLGSVPITLKKSSQLPVDVYVEVKIDGYLVATSIINFCHLETKTYQFTFDSSRYGVGSHTIEVKATLDGVSDISTRSFTINDGYLPSIPGPEHCLIVEDVWTDHKLNAGDNAHVTVRIRNCGSRPEYSIYTKLEVFGKTYPDGIVSLQPGSIKDLDFAIKVPDGVQTASMKVTVWNVYTTDTVTKEFPVFTGVPLIEIEQEYKVRECKIEKIRFDVINVGEVKDYFTLSITGDASKWITGYPDVIELEADSRETVEAYVSVPCDTKTGLYQFTVRAEGSPKYSVTSSLNVVRTFKWPTFPTGWLVDAGKWVLWGLLALLALLLLLLLLCYLLGLCGKGRIIKTGRNRPERCMSPHGC
jgi:hypothetical protein